MLLQCRCKPAHTLQSIRLVFVSLVGLMVLKQPTALLIEIATPGIGYKLDRPLHEKRLRELKSGVA